MKKINYAVLGSGRQGVAAAYDLAKNGNANKIILIDINIELAKSGSVKLINRSGTFCKVGKIFK